MSHKQTSRQRLSNEQLEQLLRQRIAAGQPVDTKSIHDLGVAGGRCRVSRLRRRLLTAHALSPQQPASPPLPSPPSPRMPRGFAARSALHFVTAFLRRGMVPMAAVRSGDRS
jgi:hypothetical protein